MCRNIQQLRGAEPSATPEEMRDAALQYVRKVSGYRKPSKANEEIFNAAVDEIAEATERLLGNLVVPPGGKTPNLVQRRNRAA